MSASTFDATRFHEACDPNRATDLCRVQMTIFDFVTLVKAGALIMGRDEELAEDFCRFVDRKEIWHLAEMMVPEFRTGELEDEDDTGTEETIEEKISVAYLLQRISLVPKPASEEWVMTTEQGMMMERALLYMEFSLTGGRGRERATPQVRSVIEKIFNELKPLLTMKGKGQSDQQGAPDQAAPQTDQSSADADDTGHNKRRRRGS